MVNEDAYLPAAGFIPDAILPEQMERGLRRDSEACGEKRLMLAVLEDGIRCFQGNIVNQRDDADDPGTIIDKAEQWIRSEDGDDLYSFINVCETLGISPAALRSALLGWKAKRDAGLADKKLYRMHLRTRRSFTMKSTINRDQKERH